MKTLSPYTYSVLRYIHDITTGEFINVGVALHAPNERYAGALCRSTYGRLSKAFPGVNPDHFKSLMRHIQSHFEQIGEQLKGQLELETIRSVEDLVKKVMARDDSSLQWAPAGAGKTGDPSATLEHLYERMVMQYEDQDSKKGRTEEDVWRHFRRNLESRQLLHLLEPAKIITQDDEIEFQHTWKNGALHCLEPVSFDLSSPDSIRDKAHKWLGRITSVAGSPQKLHLYFLVGQPQDESLMGAYENAINILRKIDGDKEIFREQQADELTELLAREVTEHASQNRTVEVDYQ